MASRSFIEPGQYRDRQRSRLPNGSQTRLNNWTESTNTVRRSAKKDNPDREREATLSLDSSSTSGRRRIRTPHTYPRTKHATHFASLENLRQRLPFDETSTENDDPLEIISIQSEDSQSQDSGVQDATPDSNQIVGRLMQIRDYLKQATTIRMSLEKDSPSSQEQIARIDKLCNHLKEQEEGYLALLQKMLADRSPGSEILNNQKEAMNAAVNGAGERDVTEGEDSDVSLDVDGASEVSECTTDLTWNARSRPAIESHMGFLSDISSLQNSAPVTSSDSSGSNPTSTLQGAPAHVASSAAVSDRSASSLPGSDLANTLTAVNISRLSSSQQRTPQLVQSNVDLFISEEVDGSFHRASSALGTPSRSARKTSPRLKQTNLPILDVDNQPFDGLIGVEFAEEVMSSSDGFEVSTQGDSNGDEQQSDKEAEVRALKQQRDLLKKMLDQQRMLKSLHERQAELLELQRKADLSEEAQPRTQAKEDNFQGGARNVVSDEDKDRDEKEDEEASDSSDVESDSSDASTGGYAEPPPTEEEREVPAELLALRQRLSYLKNVFDENLGQQMDDQRKLEALREMQASAMADEQRGAVASLDDTTSAGDESEYSNPERKKLRIKLDQLQQKKQQMEQLLGELQTLRQYRADNEGAGGDTGSESTATGHVIREQVEKTQDAAVTAGQAETVLDVMEQESKLRKLEEVRGRLDQLRGLVQYYQVDGEESTIDSETTEGQDMSLRGNIQADRQQSLTSDSVDDASDGESNISLGEFGNDPEIQEKVRKLESARERLAKLQSLVSMVQQWPESAEVLPEDLAELAATAMDETASETSTISKTSTTSGAQRFSALYEESLRRPKTSHADPSTSTPSFDQRFENLQRANQNSSNNEATNQRSESRQRTNQQASAAVKIAGSELSRREETESVASSLGESERFYLQRMEEQKQELQNLMNERNKLLKIQNELKSLHQQYTETGGQAGGRQLNGAPADSELTTGNTKNSKAASRAAVTFSKKPVDVSEPANDELYSRILEQRMVYQESKKTRGEEDQMTADVTTLATWGDSESTTDSSASDDENTPDDEGEIDEEDDGYPSDGIQQVEEEEEAYKDSDRDTYTVEDEYEFRQRYPADLQQKVRQSRRPHTHKLKEAGNPAAGDFWKPLPMPAAGGLSMSRDAAHGSGTDMISKMKEQLDATTEMCDYLLKEQHKLSLQLKGDYEPVSGSMLENRVMYSINQLYSKVIDMQAALQVTVDQVYGITQHVESREALESSAQQQTKRSAAKSAIPSRSSTSATAADRRPFEPFTSRTFDRLPGLGGSQMSRATQYSNHGSQAGSVLGQGDGDRTPTQQLMSQGSARSEATSEAKAGNRPSLFTDHNYSIPPLDLDKLIKRRQAQSQSLYSTNGGTYPSPSLSAIAAGRVRAPIDSMYKPGVSSGICGTAYADTASVSSAMSSVRGPLSGESTPVQTPSKESGVVAMSSTASSLRHRQSADSAASDHSLFEALRETIYSEVATLISQNENRPHFLIELFRELQMLSSDYLRQRGLYSLQELVNKFLTEDVSSQMRLDTDTESDILAPQPAWMLYRETGSEQTPSESCVTTDEDEVRQVLSTQHKMTPVNSSANLTAKMERVGSIKSDFADYIEQVESMSTHSTSHSQTGSAWEDPFNQDSLGDTVIHLEKARCPPLSTTTTLPAAAPAPSNASLASVSIRWGSESTVSDMSVDMPFAHSPLGDTAVDLKEAMQKVKDIDKQKEAKREAKRAARKDNQSVSETASSSSAQDNGSDNEGFTAAQIRKIDTQLLDRQIKEIMTEIIPVLREHMDNVCSQQLLHYVQQRVIQLTSQTGDSSKPDRAVEFSQFFQNQLFNILRDSLSKFEGRRMRDCGEEILVDISEILFNELAFFKLMQDLDDPEVKDRIALNKWRVASGDPPLAHFDTDTEGSTVGDSGPVISAAQSGDGNEETDDEVVSEQEDLGKDRDDAFADEVNTSGLSQEAAFTDIHYELAPSETKPMTRIGSDEDCSGDDEESSELSTDDGDDTAISRLTAQDQVASNQPEVSGQSINQSEDVNGVELVIDDLPAQLDVNTEAIAARAAAEQELLSSPAADVQAEESGQLAGSGTELKEPPTTAELASESDEGEKPTAEEKAEDVTAEDIVSPAEEVKGEDEKATEGSPNKSGNDEIKDTEV